MNHKVLLLDDDEKNIKKYLDYRNKNLIEDELRWTVQDVIKVAFGMGLDAMLNMYGLNSELESEVNKPKEDQAEEYEDQEI